MKIPEPRPGTTGVVLYSTTTKCEYALVCSQSASLSPLNGGRVPHATWRKLL
jgi:hypothetical protein